MKYIFKELLHRCSAKPTKNLVIWLDFSLPDDISGPWPSDWGSFFQHWLSVVQWYKRYKRIHMPVSLTSVRVMASHHLSREWKPTVPFSMEDKSQMSLGVLSSVKGSSMFALGLRVYTNDLLEFFSEPFGKKTTQKYFIGASYHKYTSYSENIVIAFLTSTTDSWGDSKLL